MHECVDVDVAHVIHLGEVEVGEIALAEDARIVDEDVDRAEGLARGFDKAGAVARAGKVRSDAAARPPARMIVSTTSSASSRRSR